MTATYTYTFRFAPREALNPLSPAERIAWLEAHGPLPASADVAIAAPLATWARAGARVDGAGVTYQDDGGTLRDMLCAAVRETGAIPTDLGAEAVELLIVARDADRLARDVCARNLRALAAKEPDLARAAAEGYPVEKQMLTRLAERLVEAIEASGTPGQRYTVTIADKAWTSAGERPAPRPDAFALLDCVAACVAAQNAAPALAFAKWDVSRILRVDTCSHGGGRSHYVTAVVATLRTPLGARHVTASIESQKCAHSLERMADMLRGGGAR